MKLGMLMIAVIFAVLFLVIGILYAANGDRFVDGNLGAGTSTPGGKAEIERVRNSDRYFGNDTANPTEKAEINDKKVVDGNPGDGTKTPAEKTEINGNEKR
jgi:hypothetical protein